MLIVDRWMQHWITNSKELYFMAQKKAFKDPRQISGEKEAIDIVYKWYKNQHRKIDRDSIYVVWFAFVGYSGFKCMITSHDYKDYFFEITMNKRTGEMRCDCFKRFEYIVKPADHGKHESDSNDISLI